MTDKELRKLKRAELLEIMFYLQEELSNVKQENESLRVRVDELTKAALNSKTELYEDCMQEIIHAVKNAAESCFVNGQQYNASGSSECKKVGTEQ